MNPLGLLLQTARGGESHHGIPAAHSDRGDLLFPRVDAHATAKAQQAQMLRDLQNGDVVLTTGGIVGTIVTINADDTLILQGEAG